MEIKENEVYTHEETQKLLKVSSSTITRMIKKGLIQEDALVAALSKQLQIPYLPLMNYSIDFAVAKIFDQEFCKKNCLIVVDQDDNGACIVTADPFNDVALASIEQKLGKKVHAFIATPTEIMNMLEVAYGQEIPVSQPKTASG